jgi:hypothetical protein
MCVIGGAGGSESLIDCNFTSCEAKSTSEGNGRGGALCLGFEGASTELSLIGMNFTKYIANIKKDLFLTSDSLISSATSTNFER